MQTYVALRTLETHLTRANLALTYFAASSNDLAGYDREAATGVEARTRAAVIREIAAQVTSEQEPTTADLVRVEMTFESDIERLVADRLWDSGVQPYEFVFNAPFLHARSFVFCLDGIDKNLDVLSKEPEAPGLAAAIDRLSEAAPDLRHVRNTAHHDEDRRRGLDKNGKHLTLRPVMSDGIHAPNGGALILDNLQGSRFGCTLSDGSFGTVDVSAETLLGARDAVQLAIDAYPWK